MEEVAEQGVLYREGDIVWKVLTKDYQDATCAVLARAFCTEPVVHALGEDKPEMKAEFHHWTEFVDYWMDHCASNGISVVAIDTKKHRVAGAFLVRDFLFFPKNFLETFSRKDRALTPWMHFLLFLDTQAQQRFTPLSTVKEGEAVDLWFLGVHPDYRGLKIANHLTRLALPLVKAAGFKYATIEATSAFTSKAAEWNKFTPVFSQVASEWLWEGSPLYLRAPEPHGTWTFWVKPLQEENN